MNYSFIDTCEADLHWISFEEKIQSALVISKSKRLSEIDRDTRTSTYQISRIEEKF